MRVALILTGYIDDAGVSFPCYLEQIRGSKLITKIGIFGSVHATTGQQVTDLAEFQDHFTDSKTFIESPEQRALPFIDQRGHPSIAEFASAVNHWQDQLKNYDVIWRGRWDSYLEGDSDLLDTHLKFCWNLDNKIVDLDHQRHRVITRSLRISYGRPVMEGKHHWATAHTVIHAFDDWENKWPAWVQHLHRKEFDGHSTWAGIYASIGASIENGMYTVEKVTPIPEETLEDRPTIHVSDTVKKYSSQHLVKHSPIIDAERTRQDDLRLRRASRRIALEEKIRSQNPH